MCGRLCLSTNRPALRRACSFLFSVFVATEEGVHHTRRPGLEKEREDKEAMAALTSTGDRVRLLRQPRARHLLFGHVTDRSTRQRSGRNRNHTRLGDEINGAQQPRLDLSGSSAGLGVQTRAMGLAGKGSSIQLSVNRSWGNLPQTMQKAYHHQEAEPSTDQTGPEQKARASGNTDGSTAKSRRKPVLKKGKAYASFESVISGIATANEPTTSKVNTSSTHFSLVGEKMSTEKRYDNLPTATQSSVGLHPSKRK